MKKTIEDKLLDEFNKYSIDKKQAVIKALNDPAYLQGHSYHNNHFKKTHLKIGVIGDTHIGSKYFDRKALDIFMNKCEKEKVDFYIQVGDISEGNYSQRQGHVFELSHIGFDAQLEAIIEQFPETGKKIYFINGNHDTSHMESGNSGANMGKTLASYRKDLIYLGDREADLLLGENKKTKLRISHPGGGTPYALSYKPQKIIESYGGNEKPSILIIGHFHKWESLFYRNVHSLQAGCFQSQSMFMRNLGLAAHKCGTIIEMDLHPNGTVTEFVSKMIPFYE